jgi:small subunit ribosomal protein S1
MFPDHDNPSTAAAAAPAQDSESEKAKNEGNPAHNGASEVVADVKAAKDEATAAPVAQADGDPRPENAAVANAQASGAESQGKESAAPVDAEAAAAAEEAAGSEEMSKLMEQYGEPAEAASQNEIIEVKVVAYTEQGVVVDLGQKTEGLIPAVEFSETEIPRPEPNATIEVQRTGEHKEGYLIVSYQKVLRRRTWERIDAAFKAKDTVTGKVVDRIKGGLVVDVGVRAFLPGSQFDLRPTQNLDNLLGQELQVRITKLNRRRGNVVVSRRAILEEELHSKRAALMETLTEGQVVHGHVKNVTEYGAFVDLGGIDGLLHLTDLSWGRVKHPSDVVKPEQELDVIILKFDKEKQRVSLGLKQLMADPWVNAAEKYPAGGKVRGKIVGVVDYGVFV